MSDKIKNILAKLEEKLVYNRKEFRMTPPYDHTSRAYWDGRVEMVTQAIAIVRDEMNNVSAT